MRAVATHLRTRMHGICPSISVWRRRSPTRAHTECQFRARRSCWMKRCYSWRTASAPSTTKHASRVRTAARIACCPQTARLSEATAAQMPLTRPTPAPWPTTLWPGTPVGCDYQERRKKGEIILGPGTYLIATGREQKKQSTLM